MHPIAALFGLACLGACIAAWRSGSGAAILMGLFLSTVWAGANQLVLINGGGLLAWLDLPTAMTAYALWFERRQIWQAWLCVLFGARMPMHLAYAWGGVEWAAYLHTINALFLGSLIAISWKGGLDAILADRCVRYFRRLCADVAAFARSLAGLAVTK